jgi:hypothetical protein
MTHTQTTAVESNLESAVEHIDYMQALSTAHKIELQDTANYFDLQEEMETFDLRHQFINKGRANPGEFAEEY